MTYIKHPKDTDWHITKDKSFGFWHTFCGQVIHPSMGETTEELPNDVCQQCKALQGGNL